MPYINFEMILTNSFFTATWEEACARVAPSSADLQAEAGLPGFTPQPSSLSSQTATRFPTFGTNLPDGDAVLHSSRPRRRRRFRLAHLATTPFPTPLPLVPGTIGRGFPHFPGAGLSSFAQYPLSSRRGAGAALLRASSSVWYSYSFLLPFLQLLISS